jgi:hypothetical protein
VAPITATLAAAWRLVDRSTMARAERARVALLRQGLADVANAYNYLELQELLRQRRYSAAAFAIEPIEPGEALLEPIRYRRSVSASAIEPWQLQAVVRVNGRRPNA